MAGTNHGKGYSSEALRALSIRASASIFWMNFDANSMISFSIQTSSIFETSTIDDRKIDRKIDDHISIMLILRRFSAKIDDENERPFDQIKIDDDARIENALTNPHTGGSQRQFHFKVS